MTLAQIAKQAQKFTADHSPEILTGIACAGVIGTSILVGKATLKADELLKKERATEYALGDDIPFRDKVGITWKLYIPALSSAAVTIGAIVLVNRIGSRRTAAMAAAYSVVERGYEEYRAKVVQKLGEKKELEVRDEIAAERVARNPKGQSEVVLASGEVLCYDAFTGRYFNSTVESIKKAQNDTNYQVLHEGSASLSDFYDRIGLPATSMSEELGWNLDKQLELHFSTCLSEDGKPCLSINFVADPIRHFYHIN